MNVTAKSSKDEILSASCELIDSQADAISALRQQQQILFVTVALLSAALILS